jgi:hypothetical protein
MTGRERERHQTKQIESAFDTRCRTAECENERAKQIHSIQKRTC